MIRDVVLDPATARLVAAMAIPPTLGQLGPQDGRLALREAQQTGIGQPGTVARFHTAAVGPSELVGFWMVRPCDMESGYAGCAALPRRAPSSLQHWRLSTGLARRRTDRSPGRSFVPPESRRQLPRPSPVWIL